MTQLWTKSRPSTWPILHSQRIWWRLRTSPWSKGPGFWCCTGLNKPHPGQWLPLQVHYPAPGRLEEPGSSATSTCHIHSRYIQDIFKIFGFQVPSYYKESWDTPWEASTSSMVLIAWRVRDLPEMEQSIQVVNGLLFMVQSYTILGT